MMIYLLISFLFSFTITYLILPRSISFFKSVGLTGIDIQKADKPKVAEFGGLPVLFGFLGGSFLYIGMSTFLASPDESSIMMMIGSILTIMIITLIGMIDDLYTLLGRKIGPTDKSYKREGIKQHHKFLLPVLAAVPLMALNSGISTISIPVIGSVDVGVLYPLFFIPLGLLGASNATNMLAGMNGLEAGLGIVLLSSLGIFSYLSGSLIASSIAFIFVASLVAFIFYNWYPARIFPGDSLTYTIGAVAAVVAIVGNIEKFAVLIFIPWFIELALKLRSGFSAENFGEIQKDGALKCKTDKNYSLLHVVMHAGRFKEWQVVSILISFEVLVCVSVFLIML